MDISQTQAGFKAKSHRNPLWIPRLFKAKSHYVCRNRLNFWLFRYTLGFRYFRCKFCLAFPWQRVHQNSLVHFFLREVCSSASPFFSYCNFGFLNFIGDISVILRYDSHKVQNFTEYWNDRFFAIFLLFCIMPKSAAAGLRFTFRISFPNIVHLP